ncbi:MAG: 30S ribosome-binding factor RbfA [Gammaproteobacteria bacterium]
MAREFGRTERVADYLRQELARLLQSGMRDPRIGMVSVNEVEVSRDLAHAKVFVTFMERESEQEAKDLLAVLNGAAGFLRSEISRDARMRTVPRLHFVYDASVVRGRRLSDLIDRAVAQDEKRHGTDGEG